MSAGNIVTEAESEAKLDLVHSYGTAVFSVWEGAQVVKAWRAPNHFPQCDNLQVITLLKGSPVQGRLYLPDPGPSQSHGFLCAK